jgi:hypothetical protein
VASTTDAWPLVALLLAVASAPLGCKRNATTPPGTEVLRWEASHATRRSVATAKELGPRLTKDTKIVARPDRRGPVTFALHLTIAPLEVVKNGKASRHDAPVAVHATVEANTDWTLAGRCWDGPHDQLPTIVDGKPLAPEALILTCSISMKYEDSYSDLFTSLAIEVKGDGTARPALTGGTASVE